MSKIVRNSTEAYYPTNARTIKLASMILLLAISTVNSYSANEQTNTIPTRSDQAQILKKCIDLPELQSYLMKDSDGNIQQLSIYYWHPLLFPLDLGLTKGGKDIIYKVMSLNAEKEGNPFILFRKFLITGDVAKIDFDYHYGTTISSKLLHVNLDFKKIGDEWTILNTLLTNQK